MTDSQNAALAAWGATGDKVTPSPSPVEGVTPSPSPVATDGGLDVATVRVLADRVSGCVEAAIECLEIVLNTKLNEVDQDSTRRAIDALKLAGNQRFIIGGDRLIE